MKKLIRRLTKWAWAEMPNDVSRVEWKFGRNDDGSPKRWTEWEDVREHLSEAGVLRKPKKL